MCIVLVLGSIVPQGRGPGVYIDNYGRLGALMLLFGLDRAFSSPLMFLLVLCLSASLICCSAQRVRSLSRGRILIAAPENVVEVCAAREGWAESVACLLERRGFRLSRECDSIRAHTGRAGMYGSLVVHVALLVIILGATITAGFSREEIVWIEPGSRGEAMGLSLEVSTFAIQRYPDMSPRQFITAGSVSAAGEALADFEVAVNRPARYKGIGIYQSGYDWVVTLIAAGGSLEPHRLSLSPGQSSALPGGELYLMLWEFVPELSEHHGCANVVIHDGQNVVALWHLDPGTRKHTGDIWVEMAGFSPITGLMLKKDPGTPVVMAGAVLLLVGLALVLFVTPRELIVRENSQAMLELSMRARRLQPQSIRSIAEEIRSLEKGV